MFQQEDFLFDKAYSSSILVGIPFHGRIVGPVGFAPMTKRIQARLRLGYDFGSVSSGFLSPAVRGGTVAGFKTVLNCYLVAELEGSIRIRPQLF